MLVDSFNRVIDNLRISVTDRCNFRCRYCMPEGEIQWLEREELLTFEEIIRLAQILIRLGVRKIRLTGGEPLVRKGLPTLIQGLATLEGLRDLGLTTNGYFLRELAAELYHAGLRRINVSLDTLVPEKFERIARRKGFDKVIAGLEEVQKYPIRPIKINAVILRGLNDDEILDLAMLARQKPYQVRFIEFMPLDADQVWNRSLVVSQREILERISRFQKLIPIDTRLNGAPARRYRFEDGQGVIGFISPVSEPFCLKCNRIRLTADGHLRTCLFSLRETDLKGPLRRGASDEQIAQLIVEAVQRKELGHEINMASFVRPQRMMYQIGG